MLFEEPRTIPRGDQAYSNQIYRDGFYPKFYPLSVHKMKDSLS